jgi:hypothetical protein
MGRVYNKFPIWILQNAGYIVNSEAQNKSIINHIALAVVSFGLCILSFLTISQIGFFVALYQIISVFYKCLISWFYAWNYYKRSIKQKTSGTVKTSIFSPYFHEFIILALLLVITGFAVLFALFSQQSITDQTAYVVVVDVCIAINAIFDYYNGIKGMYLAEVIV